MDKLNKIKYALAKKYGSKCFYCKGIFLCDDLQIDHIIPISKKGTWNIGNMVLACGNCNASKKNLSLEQWLRKNEFDVEIAYLEFIRKQTIVTTLKRMIGNK